MNSVIQEINKLDPYDQFQIAETIWRNLSMPEKINDLNEEEVEENEIRYSNFIKNPESGTTSEIFFAEMKQKYAL